LVATPIGNLDDLPPRAVATLKAVAAIGAEDTRHSATLLARFGIGTPVFAVHEHNEREIAERIVARVRAGESIALISDAGTPLISDPGYRVVTAARAAGITVRAVPGPCAVVVALSLAGLPTDRFVFEGFLPHKAGERRERLRALAMETRTLVFYEAKHRVVDFLQDAAAVLGSERAASLARELTKVHETVLHGTLAELAQRVAADPEQQLGEMVVVIGGAAQDEGDAARLIEGRRVFDLLKSELPPGRAAKLAAAITGAPRNALYRAGDSEAG
jgi:16S rRNA (cytidine1402-2'-O)-methyltransferase